MSKIVKLLVIIDMGHGGSDPGASGNGVIEKIANYNTGMALKEFLEKQGVKVVLTRTGDNTMSLEARTSYANKVAKENQGYKVVFISVHHNAGGGDRGEYIYSIYEGDSKALATAIGDIMNSKLGQQKKIYSKKSTTTNKDYYHVIRSTSMPAIIVEVAFLDNKTDVQICDTPEEQKRNGRVIGEGVLKWAEIPIKDENPKQPAKEYDTRYRIECTGIPTKERAEEAIKLLQSRNFKAGIVSYEVERIYYRIICYGMTSESRAKEAIDILTKEPNAFKASYESYIENNIKKYRVLCYGMTDINRAKQAVDRLVEEGSFYASYESYTN